MRGRGRGSAPRVWRGKRFDQRFPEEYTLSKEVTTEFLVNGFLGVIEWWLANDLPCSPEDITKQLMSFLDPYLKNLK